MSLKGTGLRMVLAEERAGRGRGTFRFPVVTCVVMRAMSSLSLEKPGRLFSVGDTP